MNIHKIDERLDQIIAEVIEDKPTPAQKAQIKALEHHIIELQKCS